MNLVHIGHCAWLHTFFPAMTMLQICSLQLGDPQHSTVNDGPRAARWVPKTCVSRHQKSALSDHVISVTLNKLANKSSKTWPAPTPAILSHIDPHKQTGFGSLDSGEGEVPWPHATGDHSSRLVAMALRSHWPW